MASCCAPACSQALPVKPQGVWARGSEAWAGSRDRRNLEFVRWGSSGPSSLMYTKLRGMPLPGEDTNNLNVSTLYKKPHSFSQVALGQLDYPTLLRGKSLAGEDTNNLNVSTLNKKPHLFSLWHAQWQLDYLTLPGNYTMNYFIQICQGLMI